MEKRRKEDAIEGFEIPDFSNGSFDCLWSISIQGIWQYKRCHAEINWSRIR